MADELIDIYDDLNKRIGTKMKSEAHKNALWHRASHVWIYNSKGQILLQLRSGNKEMLPDLWDVAAAGHSAAGEEPITTAIRELKEELGIEARPEELEFVKVRQVMADFDNGLKNREYVSIYLFRFDGLARKLNLQKEEVQEARFFDAGQLERDMELHPELYVMNPKDYWLKMIAIVKEKQGIR
jgi:isopentenyl-diphosphate delta-isomerase type 1